MPKFIKNFGYVKKSTLTSVLTSKYWYISWVIDINWFMHESPGLKPNWFWEIKSFTIKYSKRLLPTNVFPQMWIKETGQKFFKICYLLFLRRGTVFDFFHSVGNFPGFIQDWIIMVKILNVAISSQLKWLRR